MWSRKQPPPTDPGQSEDPLNPFNATTMRRRTELPTQPLDPNAPGSFESADFSSRRNDRLNRQTTGSRVYPTNVRTFVQNLDNRKLLMIFGGLVALVILLLAIKSLTGKSKTATTPAVPTVAPLLIPQPTANPNMGAIITAAPFLPTPEPAPVTGGGPRFVVQAGVTEGLRIRSAPGVNNAQVGTFPPGTTVELNSLEPETPADGYTWVKARGPQGEGWIAKEFLDPAQ